MAIRWDELCLYCPLYKYCCDTFGDTCEYPEHDWHAMRAELIVSIGMLEKEDEHGQMEV